MKVAIVGMGTMGTAIMQILSDGGFDTTGIDREDDVKAVHAADVSFGS